jgi:twitching motility protein PilT
MSLSFPTPPPFRIMEPPPLNREMPSGLDNSVRAIVFERWRELLHSVIALGGVSDVVVASWGRCTARRNGRLEAVPLPGELVGEEPFSVFANELFSAADNSDVLSQEAVLMLGARRLRAVDVHCDRGREITLRVIQQTIPGLDEIRLPEQVLRHFLEAEGGLFLVAGATGSGKSTSIASLLQEASRRQGLRILSIEDPVEFRFDDTPIGSIFTQRQLGRDCADYVSGLKRALRMNPDVLFVGEIRDEAVAEMVIEAASTGHRVLTTIHAWDPVSALRRLIAMATASGLPSVQDAMADCFQLCMCQKLISFGKEHPRVAVHEVLTRTDAVAIKLRQGQLPMLRGEMDTGRKFGMQTFAHSLAMRQQEGAIPAGVAVPMFRV